MIKHAEGNFEALIESTQDFIWAVDLDYRLTLLNSSLRQRFQETYGILLELGMRIHDYLPPERAAQWIPYYERALAEGSYRADYILRDGHTLALSFNPIVVKGKTTGISVFGKDITERKQAQANLSALVESTEDLIWSVDLDFRLTSYNQSVKKTLKRNRGVEIELGKNADQLLPPEVAEYLNGLFQRTLTEGTFRTEYTLLDGRIIEFVLNPIVMDGKATGISVFGKDITEQKTAGKALLEAEKKYRDIFDNALEGMYQTTIEGRLLTVNFALAKMMGFNSPEEILSSSTIRVQDAWVDLNARAEFLRQIEVHGAVHGFECQLKRRGGGPIWVSLSARRVCDADGRTLYIDGFIQDITNRRQAEIQLHDSEELYRNVFQSGPNTAVISRLSDGVIIDANQAFLDSTGFERNEVIGRTVLDLGIWVNASERQRFVDAALHNKTCRDFEALSRRKNGQTFWIRLSASLIEIAGVQCLLAFGQDISEAKAAEERLALAQEALRASEVRYRTAFQMNLDSVDICHKEDGTFIDVNDAFLRITGFNREEVIGHTALEIGIWENPKDREKLIEALSQNASCQNLEFPYRTKDRRLRLGRLSVTPIELDGSPCILSVTRDVTEASEAKKHLAKAQEALRASEEHYRTIFQTSIDGIAISRLEDGKFIDVNQAYLNIVGFEREEVIGRTSVEIGVWTDEKIRQEIVEVLRRDSYFRNLTIPYGRKGGGQFWVHLSASTIELDGVPCILSIVRDTSEIREAEERIKDLSYYDPLTHLPNRRLLLERLQHAPNTVAGDSRKRALLFIDLDEFKKLNDALGQQTGDLLLQEAARRLTACVRGSDTVARCGGDDFAVILNDLGEMPEPAATQAKIVAEKIRAALAQTYMLDGHECHCPCSIGVAVFGDEPVSAHQVFQQAELAMHQAKAAGRNTTHFFVPALQSEANARAAIEEDLYKAIKDNQFLLYYQPQVEEGRLIGAECLIRWNHPLRGLIDPDEFIPLAEENGLILPLGDWILNTACAQIAAWSHRRQMKNIPITVNISARQFRQPEFVEQALAALYRTGANPQNLKLELTESMLLENIEEVIAKMTDLKSHGLRFSLDDFGVGYSSLSYLKRLPLDQLKIDISFVRDILADASSGAIAQTIISLGRTMGMSVIAEGIETEEQRDFLVRLGCHAFQGYLYSKPLPLDEFERQWLPPTPRRWFRSN
jgi:diguanylate cyclase (GGDEF)-like protein/PAS domain S-box-containing protein